MKIKRNTIREQDDIIAARQEAGSRHRALDGAVRLDQALKANPDAARKLGKIDNPRGKPLSVPPAWVEAAARDGIDTTWTPQMRAWSDYIRTAREGRDLSASGATGSYLVPPGGFLADVLFGIRYSTSIASRCRLWESPHGNPATFPTLTAEPSTNAVQIGENTGMTDTNDPTFGRVVFGQTPIYVMPGLLRVGRSLIADAAVDIEGLVTEAFAWRISRQLDADFLATALAGVSQTSTTAANTGVTYADIVNWAYSLDLSARGSDSAAIVVSPATAKAFAALADTAGRPLLVSANYKVVSDNATQFGSQQSRTVKVPTILGVPVVENRNLASIAAGATVGVFAAWDRAFVMRFVEASVMRLSERWADYGQVGFNGWARIDGQVADANSAVRLVIHA